MINRIKKLISFCVVFSVITASFAENKQELHAALGSVFGTYKVVDVKGGDRKSNEADMKFFHGCFQFTPKYILYPQGDKHYVVYSFEKMTKEFCKEVNVLCQNEKNRILNAIPKDQEHDDVQEGVSFQIIDHNHLIYNYDPEEIYLTRVNDKKECVVSK
jgi:hypothetical protein